MTFSFLSSLNFFDCIHLCSYNIYQTIIAMYLLFLCLHLTLTIKYMFSRASQRDVKNQSLWMFLDAADTLFVVRFKFWQKFEYLN